MTASRKWNSGFDDAGMEEVEKATEIFGSTSAGASSPSSHCTVKGRKGDARYHRAVAFRLQNPSCSLYDALVAGGFAYPQCIDKSNDADVVDRENVTLAQRKNQLSRRLRAAQQQQFKKQNGFGKKRRMTDTGTPPLSESFINTFVSHEVCQQSRSSGLEGTTARAPAISTLETDDERSHNAVDVRFMAGTTRDQDLVAANDELPHGSDSRDLLEQKAPASSASLASTTPCSKRGHVHSNQPVGPIAAVATPEENHDGPPQESKDPRFSLALALFRNECAAMYSRVMLLAGFNDGEATDPLSPVYRSFVKQAWVQEHQRFQHMADPPSLHQHVNDGERNDGAQEMQPQTGSINNPGSSIENSDCPVNGRCDQKSVCSGKTENVIEVGARKTRRKKTHREGAFVPREKGLDSLDPCNAPSDSASHAPSAGGHAPCHMDDGRHIHRLDGKCGHAALLHQPQEGAPHIDFLIGDKVECYHGLQPQPFHYKGGDTKDQNTRHPTPCFGLSGDIGSVKNRADTVMPIRPCNSSNSSEIVWPSQYNCEDLFDCQQLSHHHGSDHDRRTLAGARESPVGTPQLSNTHCHHSLPLPRLFDLSDIDLNGEEWNFVNEQLDGTIQGLFKLSDSSSLEGDGEGRKDK
jgi:hypothetical protein